MKKEYAINLCDILWNYSVPEQLDPVRENMQHRFDTKEISRIYIGSYFCENYFASLKEYPMEKLQEWCTKRNMHMTLVVPLCSQHRLLECKEVIDKLCKKAINLDEICINDFGMLEYISDIYEKKICLGRLLMKEQRDPRNHKLRFQENRQYRWNSQLSGLVDEYGISGMEADKIYMDMDFSKIPAQLFVGLHEPYSYITTGRMCMFSGLHKEGALKFMADTTCQLECRKKRVYFPSEHGFFMKVGKTVYYPSVPMQYQADCTIRNIYWPCEQDVQGESL